ncbi:hypothetical protein SAMN06265377_1326 [Flagellimonas pacifica]|uniref:histidine kinase n=2 Tax=Flagellimonas pacifica TaxID=1247520 RepID=A0A285MUM4_9FLAO|nr:hypothetical protein SAMN06265377_1326 [Allomuricauda parva]
MEFTGLSTELGLSNGRVTAIAQDSIGFIWIGTKNGLNRYDGKSFKVYSKSNSNLSENYISDILIDDIGRMWIATNGGGVNLYNLASDTFISYEKSGSAEQKLNSDVVNKMFKDSSGGIWAATDKGLSYFDEKGKTFVTYLNESVESYRTPRANDILCIYQDKKGVFWIGTNGAGLFCFNKEQKSFNKYLITEKGSNSLPDYILDIISINSDSILLGTNGDGLVGIDQMKNSLFEVFDSSKTVPAIVRKFWRDKESNIWLGTDGNGLYKLSPDCKILQHYLKDDRLSNSIKGNTVTSLFEDKQGNFWIGTAWRGLSVWNKGTENLNIFYSDGKGYDSNPVLSIFKKDAFLWLGLDGQGLNKLNEDDLEVVKFSQGQFAGMRNYFVQCFEPAGGTQYWIGTFTNGLNLFDEGKGIVKKFKREKNNQNSLPFDDVRDIVVLPSGDLWIATWGGGLSYFDSGSEEFFNYRQGNSDRNYISSDNVVSLLDDGAYLWIATQGGGLNKFYKDNGVFENFQTIKGDSTSIGNNYVYSIIKDEKNILWLGTNQGISKFNKEDTTFKNFDIGYGLNSNTVVSILQDQSKILWLGTKKGIFRFDPNTNSVQLVPNTNMEFHINSAFIDESGTAYFGGIMGIIAINTKIPLVSHEYSKLVFTDFKLFNKSQIPASEGVLDQNMVINKNINLKYNQNVITFGLASLQFPKSTDNKLEVLMEGFEKEWRLIGEQTTVTYTNLSPGKYVFKARPSSSNLENGTNDVRSVQIEIEPPPWKTSWAYFLYALTFIALLWSMRFYTLKWAEIKNNLRAEKLKREKEDEIHRLKQRFFTNISHEIRTPLTLIMGTLNSLKGNFNANEQNRINAVRHSASRLMTLVNELLNIRKLETGNIKLHISQNNLVTFMHEIFLAFSQQAISKDIEYVFTPEDKTVLVWFDKVQLEKTVYNLLTNAFKFTPQNGRIEVLVGSKNNFAKIMVKDSGTGIAEDKLPHIFNRFYQNEEASDGEIGFGIGLSIVKDIIELHHGTIKANSTLGHGSTFKIRLPMGKEFFDASQLNFEAEDVEQIGTRSFVEGQAKHASIANKETEILIVEDNTYLRDFLSDLLSTEYKVVTAENGKKGLDLAMEHLPNLILSDIMMPEMDGVTLCYTLKTNVLTSHIPVILLTARDMVESIMEGYETGADDYLIKPFHEGVLRARIKNLLEVRKKLRDRYSKELLLNPKEIALNSPDQQFLEKLQKVLEDKMSNPEFHIDELALDMAMSHSGIYKKIKALTGMTLVAFIKDFRLKRAAQILKQHNFAIADVSFMVGYSDRKHFSQEFKKKFGKNPSEFSKDYS